MAISQRPIYEAVKSSIVSVENLDVPKDYVRLYLSCGHTKQMPYKSYRKFHMNVRTVCITCSDKQVSERTTQVRKEHDMAD